jgi:DNA polymerase III subunit epsilon
VRVEILPRLRYVRAARERRNLLRAGVPPALASALRSDLPDPSRNVREVPFLSLDFETTGLAPDRDRIVSAGWVRVLGGAVRLGTAREEVIRVEAGPAPESVTIHGIGHDRSARGREEAEVLHSLLQDLAGHVLVAHHASVEVAFLRAALRRCFGHHLPLLVVDTLALERRIRRRGTVRLPPGFPEESLKLDLSSVRRRYHLPSHRAHGALADALATAELLLAQCGHLASGETLPLLRLL